MIKIANPCDADWQKMHPQAGGKFCSSCEKVVVDFSKMSDAQIKEYFITYQEQKTCGRFVSSQINRELQPSNTKYSNGIWDTFNRFPVFRSLALLCASSFLWLSGCVKKQMIQGEAVPDPSCNTQLMGDTTMLVEPTDTTSMVTPKDSIEIMGEIAPEHEMITGKVRMTDTISQRIKRKK